MLRRIAALSRSNWPRPLPRPIVIGYVSRDAPTADASPPRARADVITLIRSPGAAIASVCVLVAGLLAGCSTSDGVGSFIIDPGHYSVYHCDGLAARLKVLLAREQELANLMNRAGEGGGGVLMETWHIAPTTKTPWARKRSYGARPLRRNANYPRQHSPSRPLQRRTRRNLRPLPHRSFKAIRPSAEQLNNCVGAIRLASKCLSCVGRSAFSSSKVGFASRCGRSASVVAVLRRDRGSSTTE